MATRFIGKTDHRIDEKGRVSIPAPFRKVLSDGHTDRDPGKPATFYMILDVHESIVECMTADEYERVAESIDEEEDDLRRRLLEIRHFTFATAMTLDSSGRIQVTPQMRDILGAATKLTFAGENRTFQVLPAPDDDSPTALDSVRSEYETLLAQLPDGSNIRNYGRRGLRRSRTQ